MEYEQPWNMGKILLEYIYIYYMYIYICPYDIPIIHIPTSYHIISVYYIPPGDSEYAIIKKISIVSLCHQT